MHDAFERFCQHHTLSSPGFNKFSEDLRKIHGLNKGRKIIDGKTKTIWQRCKLVKWKNTTDSSQKTLMNEETEEEKQIQEQPLEREERREEKKESREEK